MISERPTRICWKEKKTNEGVLKEVTEQWTLVTKIKIKKTNLFSHVLRHNITKINEKWEIANAVRFRNNYWMSKSLRPEKNSRGKWTMVTMISLLVYDNIL